MSLSFTPAQIADAKPIVLSEREVLLVLKGTLTQLRRRISAQPLVETLGATLIPSGRWAWRLAGPGFAPASKCPYGAVGSLLWVREAFRLDHQVVYRAGVESAERGPWKRRGTMPRSASRLTLVIHSLRVARARDRSADDLAAERLSLEYLEACWLEKHGLEDWGRDPWCWVVGIQVIKANIDSLISHKAVHELMPPRPAPAFAPDGLNEETTTLRRLRHGQ